MYTLQYLCIYCNLNVYTTISMSILQSLCVCCNLYVCTAISMCTLQSLWADCNLYVYTAMSMCILQSQCIYCYLYEYTPISMCILQSQCVYHYLYRVADKKVFICDTKKHLNDNNNEQSFWKHFWGSIALKNCGWIFIKCLTEILRWNLRLSYGSINSTVLGAATFSRQTPFRWTLFRLITTWDSI